MSLIASIVEKTLVGLYKLKPTRAPDPRGTLLYTNPHPPYIGKFWNIGFHGTKKSLVIDQISKGKFSTLNKSIYFTCNMHEAAIFAARGNAKDPLIFLVGSNGPSRFNPLYRSRSYLKDNEVTIYKVYKVSDKWLSAKNQLFSK